MWALIGNTTGEHNTAIGCGALISNTTGYNSTAVGQDALSKARGGAHNNTALGFEAGAGVDTASNVICIGAGVIGANVSHTTWIGNIYGGLS
jgi:hypothetical protein